MTLLSGDIGAFGLSDIFRLVALYRLTGVIKVTRDGGDGVVYLHKGEITYAVSGLARDFLGQRLVDAKLITQGQLRRALDEHKRHSTRKLGQILVEQGVISAEILHGFIKEQIQDAVFDLLHWDVGSFEFEEGVTAEQDAEFALGVENLIMESARRLEEWELITRRIPDLDAVIRMSATQPSSVEINIRPEEWSVLILADGSRSIREIAASTERSEFEASKLIYGMVVNGLLDVASGPTSLAGPTSADETEDISTVVLEDGSEGEPAHEQAATEAEVEEQTFAPAYETAETEVEEGGEEVEAESAVDHATLMRLIAGVRKL